MYLSCTCNNTFKNIFAGVYSTVRKDNIPTNHGYFCILVSSSMKETIKTMIFGIATRIDILNFIAKMEANE